MKLILFDIDGTLVSVDHRVTQDLFRGILGEVLGYEGDVPEQELHGKTDRQIFLELCQLIGRPREEAEELFGRFDDYLCRKWSRSLDADTVTVHPGVRELLHRLAMREDVALGLLTGNLEVAARIKLAPHGLHEYFPFGAFGSDAIDRVALPPIALERAGRHHGAEFTYDRTLIIGDSHRDIACARAWGIHVLAVGTGTLSVAELSRYQPDALCENLLDDAAVTQFLDVP